MTALIGATLVLAATTDIGGLPALPAVSAGFLLANADLLWHALRRRGRAPVHIYSRAGVFDLEADVIERSPVKIVILTRDRPPMTATIEPIRDDGRFAARAGGCTRSGAALPSCVRGRRCRRGARPRPSERARRRARRARARCRSTRCIRSSSLQTRRKCSGCGANGRDEIAFTPCATISMSRSGERSRTRASIWRSSSATLPTGRSPGRSSIRDAAGKPIAEVPVDSPEEMNVTPGPARPARVPQLRPRPRDWTRPARRRRRRVDRSRRSVLVAGVDGYRKGWVAGFARPERGRRGLDPCHVRRGAVPSRARDRRRHPDRSGRARRSPGRRGRASLRGRQPCEQRLPTPPRAALEARTFGEANEIARTITGKGISQQAFALGKKILEVHALAEVDERVIEMHPEVSFCELSGAHVLESKHSPEGLERRREILAAAGIRLPGAVRGVPEADLLDAAVGAWTAARYSAGKAQPVPAGPHRPARRDLALTSK